jgi:hexosaminidase
MKKVFKIIGWVLLILLFAGAIAWFGFLKPEPPPISVEDRAEITLMPLPSHLKMGKGTFVLEDQIGHNFTSLSTPRMDRAMARIYHKLSIQTGLAIYKPAHYLSTPLNRVVDAALQESLLAY